MPFIFFSLIFLNSFTSWGNSLESVFRKETHLPLILQEKILSRLQREITNLRPFSLKEVNTDLRVDRIDQGIRDLYYTTNFEMSINCGLHPSTAYVTVESAEFSFYCQEYCNFEIVDIEKTDICE